MWRQEKRRDAPKNELTICLQVEDKKSNKRIEEVSNYAIQHTELATLSHHVQPRKGIDKMVPEMAATRQGQLINKLRQLKSSQNGLWMQSA